MDLLSKGVLTKQEAVTTFSGEDQSPGEPRRQ